MATKPKTRELRSTATFWLSAALIAVIALLAIVIVTTGGDDSDDQPKKGRDGEKSSATSAPPEPENESPSVCGLAAGDWDAADSPPTKDVRWLTPYNLAAPSAPSIGPGETFQIHTCFARNPLGAVSSAMWFLVDAENPDVREEVLVGVRASEDTALEAFGRIGSGDIDGEFVGYKFLDIEQAPTPDRVDLELLIRAAGSTPDNDALLALRLVMVWENGDWKLEVPPDGLETRNPTSTEGFTSWGPDGTDPDGSGSAVGLSRPAPTFAAAAPGGDRPWEEAAGCGDNIDPSTWNGGADPALDARERCWVAKRTDGYDLAAFASATHAERLTVIRTTDEALTADQIKFLTDQETADEGSPGFYWSRWPDFYRLKSVQRDAAIMLSSQPLQASGSGKSGCGKTDVTCIVKQVTSGLADAVEKGVSSAVSNVADSGVAKLAAAFMGAWDGVMKDFLTSWLKVGILVDLDGASVQWLTDQLGVITGALAVIGIMLACIWTMFHARGDRFKEMTQGLFRVFLVSTIGTAIMTVLIPAGDEFSKWIVDEAGVTVNSWQGAGFAALVTTNPGLAIVAGLLGTLATLFQWGIMLVRTAILPLLVAVWPMTAAAAMIRGGEQAFSTLTKWIIAFLIYKPVAAIVYAFAWKLKSSDLVGEVISGLILIVLAVFALPALMRLLSPGVSALGSAFGGSMAVAATGAVVAAGVAAGAAVATGGASTAATAGGGSAGGMSAGGGGAQMAGGAPAQAGAPGAAPDPAGQAPGGSGSGRHRDSGADPGGAEGASAADGSGARGLQAGTTSAAGSFAEGADNDPGSDIIGGDQG